MPVHIYLSTHLLNDKQWQGLTKKSQWQDQVTQFVPIMEVRLAILGVEIPSFWDDFHWIPTCKKTPRLQPMLVWYWVLFTIFIPTWSWYCQKNFYTNLVLESLKKLSYQLGLGIVEKLSYQPGPGMFGV